MRKTFTKIAISAALAFGLAGASVTVAEAGVPARNMAVTPASAGSASVVDVQYRHHRRHHRRHHHRRHYRGGSSFFFGFGTPYYYRAPPVYARPRYVRPAYRGHSRAHVRWCYDRYRSYRASDNTFQPYHGPRRQCYSPYR